MRVLIFLVALASFSRLIAADCNEAKLYTSNISICIEENIPFEIALGCGEANLDSTSELVCLMHWAPADIAKECGDANLSPVDETVCVVKRTVERRGALGQID